MKLAFSACFIFLLSSAIQAQFLVNARAGLITFAEGKVFLEEEPFNYNGNSLEELKKGQQLRTRTGKVEVQLGPSATLWMNTDSKLRMIDQDLRDIRIQIDRGTILIEVVEANKSNSIKFHLKDSIIEFKEIGMYLTSVDPPRLYVFEGKAEVSAKNERETVNKEMYIDFGQNLEQGDFDQKWENQFFVWVKKRSEVIYGQIKNERRNAIIRKQQSDARYRQTLQNQIQREQQRQQREAERQRLEEQIRRQREAMDRIQQ